MSAAQAEPPIGPAEEAAFAEALIANPLLRAILAELDTDATRAWRAAKSTLQREECWFDMMAIQKLGHRIRSRLETKKLNEQRRRHG